VVPCSKIAHLERAHKPYSPDLSKPMIRNALRVAEIWMDEYKSYVNIAWNIPLKVTVIVNIVSRSVQDKLNINSLV